MEPLTYSLKFLLLLWANMVGYTWFAWYWTGHLKRRRERTIRTLWEE